MSNSEMGPSENIQVKLGHINELHLLFSTGDEAAEHWFQWAKLDIHFFFFFIIIIIPVKMTADDDFNN